MKEQTKKATKILFHLLFWAYIAIVIKALIFKYPNVMLREIAESWDRGVILRGLSTANFIPFKTISMYIHYYKRLNSFENIFGNIFVFVPFGFLIPFSWKKHFHGGLYVTFMGFLFSMGIELAQLISGFGAFDVDDLILNALGAFFGYLAYKALKKIYKKTEF